MGNPLYRVQVNAGRKSGASHPIPLGELSIGTTLDSQFFIGCADMWHQLLSATASADLRSASPSRDALPEQLMRVVVSHDLNGLSLLVEQGFAEVGQRRMLPGESCAIDADTIVQVGASELEFLVVERTHEDERHFHVQLGASHQAESGALTKWGRKRSKASLLGIRPPKWLMNGWAANAGLTAIAVSVLSFAMLTKPASEDSIAGFVEQEAAIGVPPPATLAHDGRIYNEQIVAIVSSEPAFVMTDSGRRYDLGAVVDGGFRISQINNSTIKFSLGAETQIHQF